MANNHKIWRTEASAGQQQQKVMFCDLLFHYINCYLKKLQHLMFALCHMNPIKCVSHHCLLQLQLATVVLAPYHSPSNLLHLSLMLVKHEAQNKAPDVNFCAYKVNKNINSTTANYNKIYV